MQIHTLLQKVTQKKHLTQQESYLLLLAMMHGEVTPVQISSFLTALSMKGETQEEIKGFIQAMRDQMVTLSVPQAIDVCGTGGDGKNAFNISTAVAFVVAGAGVPVAKHGNRAASSYSGSADVLEELGVNINISIEKAEEVFKKTGIVFLFAPLFHKSMKVVSLVRKDLRIRTIFNYLGPFTNPGKVTRQLISISDTTIAEIVAQVTLSLPYDHVIITATEDGFDEISLTTETHIYEVKNKKIMRYTISPEEFGFARASYQDLKGGDAPKNAKVLKEILHGQKGPKRDIVVFNSGVALYISGKADTIQDGIRLAEISLDSGSANQRLENLKFMSNQE